MKSFFTIFLLTIFTSPVYLQSIDKSKIKKTSRSDEKIIFVKVTKDNNNHFINGFEKSFELINGKNFKYNKFENKTGTFLGKYRDNNEKFWLYKMDDGLYVRSKINDFWEKDSDYNNKNNNYFVFLKDLEILKNNYINKEVWLNKTDGFKYESFRSFISLSDDWFERFDKVKILEINTFYNGGQGNIWFNIVNDSDGKGRLKYDKTFDTGHKQNFDYNYYLYNPLNPDWGDDIIKLIKNKQVKIGMSEYQVIVSWGKPDDINRTTTSSTSSEQWVYSSRYSSKYLYFKNGELTTIQN